MSDIVWVALIASVAPTIAAIAAWRASKRNGVKADQIHVLVNSNLERVQADLALANSRIAGLINIIENHE